MLIFKQSILNIAKFVPKKYFKRNIFHWLLKTWYVITDIRNIIINIVITSLTISFYNDGLHLLESLIRSKHYYPCIFVLLPAVKRNWVGQTREHGQYLGFSNHNNIINLFNYLFKIKHLSQLLIPIFFNVHL